MSQAVRSYLSDVFGVEDCSDCTIVFTCPQAAADAEPAARWRNPPPADARDEPVVEAQSRSTPCDVALGDPIPAHTLIICGGSQRFRAQVERWTAHQHQDDHYQRPQPGATSSSKPVLRVPLDCEEELPHALVALRFMYTGKLNLTGVATMLRVRRQAAYLQVDGCVDACDAAILARVKDTTEDSGMGPLAGVSELHATAATQGLLPSPADEPGAVRSVMDACRLQLLEYATSVIFEGESIASVGELLGWAFGDAPSVLSNRPVRQQVEALSVVAMEALLGCGNFATDDESSVLLMLATWMEVNSNTSPATRNRLCRLVRLSQLSDTYLYAVLPCILRWFPIGPDELRFLYEYLRAPPAKRAGMAAAAAAVAAAGGCKYDCASPWYCPTARPALPCTGVRSYGWSVSQSLLKARLAEDPLGAVMTASFRDGYPHVVSYGFEWQVRLEVVDGGKASAVRLCCSLPPALRANVPPNGKLPTVITPGSVRLAVYQWRADGSRQEAWSCECRRIYMAVGSSWTSERTLPLGGGDSGPAGCAHESAGRGEGDGGAAAASTAGTCPNGVADPLAAWSAYLHDGKISGVLEWTAAAAGE